MKHIFLALFIGICANAADMDNTEADEYKIGKKIYELTCKSCHGEHGEADEELSFVVRPRNLQLSIRTKEQMYLVIRDGAHRWGAHADIMPSFKSVYSDKELHGVAAYVAGFNAGVEQKTDELMAKSEKIPEDKLSKMYARGKKIYKRNCSWCHGISGGGDGEATHNPELSIFPYVLKKSILTEDQIFLYVKYGGKYWGTYKDDMSAWSVKYDDFTLKSVAKYIKNEL